MTDSLPTPTIKHLYSSLSQAGVSKSFVKRHILPPWWHDSIADTPAGYAEAAAIISRNLSLDLVSLFEDGVPIRQRQVGSVSFKKAVDVTEDALSWPKAIAVRAAELALRALSTRAGVIPDSPRSIRDFILEGSSSYVTLPTILDYCWGQGIPVIHVSTFPGRVKMDAVAALLDRGPAIILTNNHGQRAWLLFHIAHELGHIALKHLDSDRVVADREIRTDDANHQECAANNFALELLAGNSDFRTTPQTWPRAETLAKFAQTLGEQYKVDPGVVVLNYAWTSQRPGHNPWLVANRALAILEPDSDAPDIIRSEMLRRLDWSRLPPESAEHLLHITRCSVVAAASET